jgi:transposase-like protein
MSDEPNADTPPPGSSESFNDFKTRILSAMGDISSNNQGNAVVVTHSKPIGIVQAWEHAGYPPDGSIHQDTYDASPDKNKPGKFLEVTPFTQNKTNEFNQARGQGDLDQEYTQGHPIVQADRPEDRIGDWVGKLINDPVKTVTEGGQPPAEPPALGAMFGGFQGWSASEKLWYSVARDMEEKGATPTEIFRRTNMYKDVDGNWKNVINNKGAEIDTTHMIDKSTPPQTENPSGWGAIEGSTVYKLPYEYDKQLTLKDIYKNPTFYRMYPEAANINVAPVSAIDEFNGIRGSFTPAATSGHQPTLRLASASPESMRDTLHHELQHYIQSVEGWPSGANTRVYTPKGLTELSKSIDDLSYTLFQEVKKDGQNLYTITNILDKGIYKHIPEESGLRTGKGLMYITMDMIEKNPAYLKLMNEEELSRIKYIQDHPGIKDALHTIADLKNKSEELQSIPRTMYFNTLGEVEARNASDWAALTQDQKDQIIKLGMTPRDSAAIRNPERSRVVSPFDIAKGTGTSESIPDIPTYSVNKMRSMFNNGKTAQEIADEMNMSVYHVQMLKKIHNMESNLVNQRPKGPDALVPDPSKKVNRTWTEERLDQAQDLYNQGKTHSEVADALGVPVTSLNRARRDYATNARPLELTTKSEPKAPTPKTNTRLSSTQIYRLSKLAQSKK